MKASGFDEIAFFRAIVESPARALLIGRRGLIALGMPVMTRDYDFWIPAEDAAALDAAVLAFDMLPSRSPEQARLNGRYVLENDEHVDVLVARSVSTIGDVAVPIPCIDDYILTKRFGARPRDADDIRWLERLRDHPP